MQSHRSWIFALCLYLSILATLSLAIYRKIIPYQITKITPVDLTGHFILIGFISFLAHLSLKKYKVKILSIPLPLAPTIILLFCCMDEVMEKFTWHQGVDRLDLVADLSGIIFFTWLAEQQNFKKLNSDR